MLRHVLVSAASISFYSLQAAASAPIPTDYLVEAQSFCVDDQLSQPAQEIEGSMVAIPHCVTFSNGKAIYSPRGGMLANSSLFEFDYKVIANSEEETTIQVAFEDGKTYQYVRADELNLSGIVYKKRLEMPNPGYLVSTQMTHRILIDSRQLDSSITLELTPGPEDEAEECSGLPLLVEVEPNAIKTYEVPFMCGKGYGTYLEGGKVLTAADATDTSDKAFYFDSREIRGLNCFSDSSFAACETIEL